MDKYWIIPLTTQGAVYPTMCSTGGHLSEADHSSVKGIQVSVPPARTSKRVLRKMGKRHVHRGMLPLPGDALYCFQTGSQKDQHYTNHLDLGPELWTK